MGDLSTYANLHTVDLINSMLVVDPERRFTIEQCLAHPWLTQAASGQGESVKSTPVLKRKPTMLNSGRVVPSSTYIASSKELQSPEPGHSPPDPMISMSETKGKGKISSVDLGRAKHLIFHKTNVSKSHLIKHTEMRNQYHSMYKNIHDEYRRHDANSKINADTGDDMLKSAPDKISSVKSAPDKISSKKPSQRAILSEALEKANTAVQLDHAQDYQGARLGYREACDLLHEVIVRTSGHEDKKKLEAIVSLYRGSLSDLFADY